MQVRGEGRERLKGKERKRKEGDGEGKGREGKLERRGVWDSEYGDR